MAKSENTKIELDAMVDAQLNGKKGFANTSKMRRLGLEGYREWLAGKIAQHAVAGAMNSRRKKRLSR